MLIRKIFNFLIFLGTVYLIVFLTLNIINWKKEKEIQQKKEIEISSSLDKDNFTEKENSIEIPKIDIIAPLVSAESTDTKDLKKSLDKGVVLYPQSALPGENGQVFILGHSAPSGWPKIKYDWVFSRLNDLEKDDEVFINFQHKRYIYKIIQKIFLEKGEKIPDNVSDSKSVLYLISCWPPGRDIRRIAVEAYLK